MFQLIGYISLINSKFKLCAMFQKVWLNFLKLQEKYEFFWAISVKNLTKTQFEWD